MNKVALLLASGCLTFALCSAAQQRPTQIHIPPDEIPVQRQVGQFRPALVETTNFIRAEQARRDFEVTGEGLTAAVLDTGLFVAHPDFKPRDARIPRVPAQVNFTADNAGRNDDAADGQGHGTNVAGIIAANGMHRGIALDARIIPIKVLDNGGNGDFGSIDRALQWVIDNRSRFNITAVNLSLSDQQNYLCDGDFETNSITAKVQTLRNLRIPVIVAAGNGYYVVRSVEGMSFPAILKSTISVGAVYDASVGPFEYADQAQAFATAAGQICPFSQRLHASSQNTCQTDIFAPGAPITSTGLTANGESIQQGTSQAAPVVTGVILLMQQYYLRQRNELPTVDALQDALRNGAVSILDDDQHRDNVGHTNQMFRRLDAVNALLALQRQTTAAAFRDLKAAVAMRH